MKYPIGILALLLTITMFFSCIECKEEPVEDIITEVKYGSSFGECIGYCNHQITLNAISVTSLHTPQGIDTLFEKSCSITFENWDALTDDIDFEDFQNLNDVIGCPDCADGGAEWIEISKGGQTYKVTFEYFNQPSTTEPYIEDLRMLMSTLTDLCL